jgi:MOSC domain-containing protein YiiM
MSIEIVSINIGKPKIIDDQGKPDSKVEIIEEHAKQISIHWANHMMHHDLKNIEGIKKILAVDALSNSWRKTFTKRLEGTEVDAKEI